MNRFNGNVVPFASNSSSGERSIFGDAATSSDDIDTNLNSDFIVGWENGLVAGADGDYPPQKYFNAAMYTVSYLISYLYERGIAEYNATQIYQTNSIVVASNGNIYKSTIDSNVGNNPITDTVNWTSIFDSSGFVTINTAQTVTALKTFSVFPITPSALPTSDYQAANKKYVDSIVPSGEIKAFSFSTVPIGYLECNGSAISRTTYSSLFSKIGTTYGVGDGSTTFNIPDLRGEFLRGWDNGRGVDSSRTLGSSQSSDLESHSHSVQGAYDSEVTGVYTSLMSNDSDGTPNYNYTATTDTYGGTETRPRNISVMYCIKY